MSQKAKNIYIKPLMPAPQLALRQLRIMTGLLKDGLSREEIQRLQWYDRDLEKYYPGEAVNTHTVTLPVTLEAPVTQDVTLESDEDRRRRLARLRQAKRRAKE